MRLIDADEIRKKAVPHTKGEHGYNANIRKWAVLVGDIDDATTIEAESVKHGRWVRIGCDEFVCSECCAHCEYESIKCEFNYCPNCGAKMQGGADHD